MLSIPAFLLQPAVYVSTIFYTSKQLTKQHKNNNQQFSTVCTIQYTSRRIEVSLHERQPRIANNAHSHIYSPPSAVIWLAI